MTVNRTRILKSVICVILCLAAVLPSAVTVSSAPVGRGPWDRWYTDPAKLISGREDVARGDGKLTRAMLPAIIARIAGADVSPYNERIFDDVPAGRWYSTSVAWGAKNGIVRGADGGNYRPSYGVTEDQIYYAMVGFYSYLGRSGEMLTRGSVYEKMRPVSDWAKDIAAYFGSAASGAPSDGDGPASRIAEYMKDPARDGGEDAAGSVVLDRRTVTVDAESSVKLNAAVSGGSGAVWTVDRPDVALVGVDGTVHGLSEGYATVTATTAGGKCAASCVVRVFPAPVRDPDGTRRVDPDKPMVAVTFDDGPGKYTDQILDTLEKYGAVATFFEQGKNLAYWPDAVNRALSLGCELGSHSWDHPKFKNLSESQIADQIERTNKKFVEITGKAPTLIRPPYGGRNATVDAVCKRYGMVEIMWSIDTLDWKVKDAATICETIRNEVYDGAVILVHSTHDFTAEAAETFIPELIAAGYQLVTVSELAEARGVTLEPGSWYRGFKKN